MSLLFKKYFVILVTIFMVGCGSSSDDSSPTSSDGSDSSSNASYSQMTISHMNGADFSEGGTAADWELQDGYTTVWSSTGYYVSGESYGSGVWYSNNVSDDQSAVIYIQALGNVDLNSVTSVDTTAWHTYGTPLQSLQVNNVYVVKTRDGYAKFKVVSLDLNSSSFDWGFTADYKYSATTSF